MKQLFLFILILFVGVSCVKITYGDPIITETKIIHRHHEESKTEYTYHYGYSVMKGKVAMHYGPRTKPEVNEVSFIFLGDTITYDSANLYQKESDLIFVTYQRVYKDGIFHHNSIIKVE